MTAVESLAAALNSLGVRYVVIGMAGVNYWARSSHTIFATQDFDILLPPDPGTLLTAWRAAEGCGLELFCGDEPLDRPRDASLAERVVQRRALVRATDHRGIDVDFSLVMAGFDFEVVYARHRRFIVDAVPIPVARLSDLVASKAAAGREKDRLFLASHADALRRLIEGGDD
jgi:hypothetical protein